MTETTIQRQVQDRGGWTHERHERQSRARPEAGTLQDGGKDRVSTRVGRTRRRVEGQAAWAFPCPLPNELALDDPFGYVCMSVCPSPYALLLPVGEVGSWFWSLGDQTNSVEKRRASQAMEDLGLGKEGRENVAFTLGLKAGVEGGNCQG